MWWVLIVLGVAGAIAYAIWDYRRKSAARAAASQARFEQLFGAPAPGVPEAERPTVAVVVPTAAEPAASAIPAATAVAGGGRFLRRPETLVYRLLKAGMPDHEIFASVMLSAVVGASGSGSQREQQLRRLSQVQLDFVVCDREMRVIAVVEVEAPAGADVIGMRRFKAECLQAAGIRVVRFDAAALPRSHEIRGLVSGRPGNAGP